MNLYWLKYVSFAFVGGAAFFYFVIRLDSLKSLSRAAKLTLYALCITLACVAWYVAESNADHFSPRRLVVGTVTWVNASHHKYGIEDNFQLQQASGSPSPRFSTNAVADRDADQPIHPGDQLGVLYRTWDDVPLTIDELQGERTGWHYRRYDNGSAYTFAVAVAGSIGFVGLVAASRKRRTGPVSETTPSLND